MDKKTSNRKLSLIGDAQRAGYRVSMGGSGETYLTRKVGRWQKTEGIVIYADGTAFDVTVDCEAAKCLQSYKSMRIVLGI